MTRWARANNAHKRQPSEPSSWDELKKSHSNPDFKINDWRKERRLQSKQWRQEKRRMKVHILQKQTKNTCFNCRSTDHVVADCPTLPKADSTAAGICFKCGSTEHKSHACKAKSSSEVEFPFASCFICQQKGHLSSTCPENKSGIFPKGGSCHLCGSVQHLIKDCPQSFPNRNSEKKAETTVRTMKVDESVDKLDSDDDICEPDPEPKPKKKWRKTKKFSKK
uniref:CCHC-type domain-containing protein n=1 Tax=Strigamia maritima TaxID=126957 RepID=T1JEV5_STRMM